MDVVRTSYKELFNIRLVHPAFATGYGSNIFSYLTVAPDKSTRVLFARFEMDYRCVNDSIICFARSEMMMPPAKEPKKLFAPFTGDFFIRFLITATSGFLSKTYVAAAGSKMVYRFTNLINNVQGTDKFISRLLDDYNAANSYDAGTIVNSAGELYTTLQPVKGADGIVISNPLFWKNLIPTEQVVNNADLENAAVVKPDESCFAVIDVFTAGTTNASYNILGASQQLLSPAYTISFKSKT